MFFHGVARREPNAQILIYSFTISISWLLYLHLCPFSFFPPFSNIIILDLPIFTVSFFFLHIFLVTLGYYSLIFNLPQLLMSPENFSSVYIFWLPITDPPSFLRSHIPSMSSMKRSNSSGLIGQPCRTPPRSMFPHIFFKWFQASFLVFLLKNDKYPNKETARATRKNFVLEELPNSSKTEDMRKIR